MASESSLDGAAPSHRLQVDLDASVELVRRAKHGDDDALNALLRRYEDRVLRVARIRMGARVRGFMESMDVVQNAYLVAIRKIGGLELRSHSSIIQWLTKIVENQIHDAVDYASAQKRTKEREVHDEAGPGREPGRLAERVPAAGPTPLEQVSDAELQEIYDACVELLEGDQREAILLRDYTGASWDEVARELGRPSARAARELHRRAQVRLAEILSQRVGSGE